MIKMTKQAENLINKFKDKTAIVGIVGLGYVGLPLLLRFAAVGFRVIGIDIDENKVELLNKGQSYIEHITADKIQKYQGKYFNATTDFSMATECDALILCVPTPLTKYREPDLSFVIQTIESLIPYVHAGQIFSLESTTYPGTTEEILYGRLEKTGFKIGEDIFLAYSPEREDPGNPHFDTATIPKVCSGVSKACLEVAVALYQQIIQQVVPVSSPSTAEMTKLLENIHRAVNIGLVNEMKIVADKMGIDIFEVVHAAATKPFGFVPYYPGPGIGGHCIPIDPFYLTWKAREYGLHTRFIELAGEINNYMPKWVVHKISDALNERNLALKGSRILILGVAYKRNVDDIRESPSLHIMDLLNAKGATLAYSDPHVPVMPSVRHHEPFHLESVDLTPTEIASYDCVVIATAHQAFPYELIAEHAKLIIDTRGVYHDIKTNGSNIVRA